MSDKYLSDLGLRAKIGNIRELREIRAEHQRKISVLGGYVDAIDTSIKKEESEIVDAMDERKMTEFVCDNVHVDHRDGRILRVREVHVLKDH